ncbi:hypothetical protein QFZ22_006109 [Streptomyces canus]|uniref:Uncharacterized protein n=1 Tax=Streptomyces canus TaxID=58343 RepID=A0AAW8FKA5_9ACTN|nr:hypothetical protein [Streptomyces canus]MDQ0910124.1 hypothetical protein [Streptomyces canus]
MLTTHPDAAVVVCDVCAVERATAADLDHLAQLRPAARRTGRTWCCAVSGLGCSCWC